MSGAASMSKMEEASEKRERATRRVRDYFGAMADDGQPIEKTVQGFIEIVGCSRDAIYSWKNGRTLVSNAYCDTVERAVTKLEKKRRAAKKKKA